MSETAPRTIRLVVNGRGVDVDAHPMVRLLDVLRVELGLTGTKEGCGEGECGACSVLVNGELVNSCLTPVLQAEGATITTIEGVAGADATLTAVQQAFIEYGGAQCGICTPGMIIAATSLLARHPRPVSTGEDGVDRHAVADRADRGGDVGGRAVHEARAHQVVAQRTE